MDREQAMTELATTHAVALRLRDAGQGDAVIATALAVPIESVPGLLVIAGSKLDALVAPDA